MRDPVSKEADDISEDAPKAVFCLPRECAYMNAVTCIINTHMPMYSHWLEASVTHRLYIKSLLCLFLHFFDFFLTAKLEFGLLLFLVC